MEAESVASDLTDVACVETAEKIDPSEHKSKTREAMVEMNQSKDRLYLYGISRRDLPVHQQAIQAAHAQFEYLREQSSGMGQHPNFVWLAVENKRDLLNLHASLKSFGIKVLAWSDEDYEGYEISAISCLMVDSERHLLQDIDLWNCGQFSEEEDRIDLDF